MTMNMTYVEVLDMMLYFGERRKLWDKNFGGVELPNGGKEKEKKKKEKNRTSEALCFPMAVTFYAKLFFLPHEKKRTKTSRVKLPHGDDVTLTGHRERESQTDNTKKDTYKTHTQAT
jgi:hypothetical protein